VFQLHQLRRCCHFINVDEVLGTHNVRALQQLRRRKVDDAAYQGQDSGFGSSVFARKG